MFQIIYLNQQVSYIPDSVRFKSRPAEVPGPNRLINEE
jgi:hypothetical protein